jgi:TubC N-terminal docking domain
LSALTIIKEAADCGVRLNLNGDSLALKATTNPPASLLANIKAHKAEIVALLRQEADEATNAATSRPPWWPEPHPRIVRELPFGSDGVPERYRAAWQALLSQCPAGVDLYVWGRIYLRCHVSSREAYVSPTRGAQGNALETILAMAFVLDGELGETTIESQRVAHRITFSIDPIRQEPRIARVCEASLVKSGTRVAISWPVSASSILDGARDDFLRNAEDYTWLNPHLSLLVWNHDSR